MSPHSKRAEDSQVFRVGWPCFRIGAPIGVVTDRPIPTRGASSSAGVAHVHLIDLLPGDVDLKGWDGKPANGCQGLDGAHQASMGPVDAALLVLGLDDRQPSIRGRATCVLGFVQPEEGASSKSSSSLRPACARERSHSRSSRSIASIRPIRRAVSPLPRILR
jgi:hypothetical protein